VHFLTYSYLGSERFGSLYKYKGLRLKSFSI